MDEYMDDWPRAEEMEWAANDLIEKLVDEG
jgi:hypothetical protein